MSYTKEFNAADYAVPSFLQTAYWQDMSWHNDSCPKFENDELGIVVWIDNIDPASREYDDWKQYTVVKIIDTSDGTILEDDSCFATDDIVELQEWIHKYSLKEILLDAFTTANRHSCTYDIADELAELLTRI